MDSQLSCPFPTEELVDIVDEEWLGEQLSDDEIDISELLLRQQQQHALEQMNTEDVLSVQFSQQLVLFEDDDENPNDSTNDDDSMLDLMNQTFHDENSSMIKNSTERKRQLIGEHKQWNELNLEAFHLAYDIGTKND